MKKIIILILLAMITLTSCGLKYEDGKIFFDKANNNSSKKDSAQPQNDESSLPPNEELSYHIISYDEIGKDRIFELDQEIIEFEDINQLLRNELSRDKRSKDALQGSALFHSDLKDKIEEKISERRIEIIDCYRRFLRDQKSEYTKLSVSVRVEDSGEVLSVESTEEETDDRLFSCVKDEIKTLRFRDLESNFVFKKTWVFSGKTQSTKTTKKKKGRKIQAHSNWEVVNFRLASCRGVTIQTPQSEPEGAQDHSLG